MEAAVARDEGVARAEIEMVGVAEDDARAHLGEIARQHALDGGTRADRHEHRGVDRPVRRVEHPAPGQPVAMGDAERERGRHRH
jgi:hypothetical protein